MDARQFDELVARLARAASRREALGGALGAIGISSVVSARDKNTSKGRGNGKGKGKRKRKAKARDSVSAEACIPTGKKCPAPKPRGKHKKHKHKHKHKKLKCKQCCQGFTVRARNGKRKCACRPTGTECRNPFHCCSGICSEGLCRDYGG